VVCGEDLLSWVRVGKTTCGSACHSRLSRTRKLREASPRPTNPVILALVVALRDVEQRRARGNVVIDSNPKEPTS
jgi:hypothetical protein